MKLKNPFDKINWLGHLNLDVLSKLWCHFHSYVFVCCPHAQAKLEESEQDVLKMAEFHLAFLSKNLNCDVVMDVVQICGVWEAGTPPKAALLSACQETRSKF